MVQAKAKRKKYVTPDEALDRLLAEHDRKNAKAAKKEVGRGQFAIRDQESMDEEELETQPPGVLVAEKVTTIKQAGFVKVSKKVATKKPTAGAVVVVRRNLFSQVVKHQWRLTYRLCSRQTFGQLEFQTPGSLGQLCARKQEFGENCRQQGA